MRPDAVAKVDLAGDRTAGDVNDHHLVAIGTRFAHTRAPIDGHIGRPSIRGGGHLVTRNASFRDRGQLLGRHRIGPDVVPEDADRAAVGAQQAHGHRQRGGLARAIRADQAEE